MQLIKNLDSRMEIKVDKRGMFFDFSKENLDKIIANIKIEIENVYFLYEDAKLKQNIGLLLPKIEVKSLNEMWQQIDSITDPSVITKLLTIQNVSLHVNYGEKFKSIFKILGDFNYDK
jgi:hypothetical protein